MLFTRNPDPWIVYFSIRKSNERSVYTVSELFADFGDFHFQIPQ